MNSSMYELVYKHFNEIQLLIIYIEGYTERTANQSKD